MKRHVEFLSTLYQVWGAIFVLVALAGFALAAGAAAIATSSGAMRFGSEMAAQLTAVTITIIAVIALIWGALHIVAGRMLRRFRPSARLMSIGLAVGNLILFPFGSGLGGYAFWVLLKDEGRSLFEEPPPGGGYMGGGSTVPSGVHGPHRKILFAAIQPPRIAPNVRITASP